MPDNQNGPQTTVSLDGAPDFAVPADVVLPLQALLVGRLHERLVQIATFDREIVDTKDAGRSIDVHQLAELDELLDQASDVLYALVMLRPDAERASLTYDEWTDPADIPVP